MFVGHRRIGGAEVHRPVTALLDPASAANPLIIDPHLRTAARVHRRQLVIPRLRERRPGSGQAHALADLLGPIVARNGGPDEAKHYGPKEAWRDRVEATTLPQASCVRTHADEAAPITCQGSPPRGAKPLVRAAPDAAGYWPGPVRAGSAGRRDTTRTDFAFGPFSACSSANVTSSPTRSDSKSPWRRLLRWK